MNSPVECIGLDLFCKWVKALQNEHDLTVVDAFSIAETVHKTTFGRCRFVEGLPSFVLQYRNSVGIVSPIPSALKARLDTPQFVGWVRVIAGEHGIRFERAYGMAESIHRILFNRDCYINSESFRQTYYQKRREVKKTH